MKAYTIDNNGYLTGETELQASPLEPGVYFDKPGTVKDAPLPEKEGNAIKWNGESWEYVIDNRGDVYYDTETKEKKIITEIGQEPDATWTKKEPGQYDIWGGSDWTLDVEAYKKFSLQRILNSFDDTLTNGYFHSETLNAVVDARRSGTRNDLQNVYGLANYMERHSIPSVTYVAKYEAVTATLSQIQQLAVEMEEWALGLYQKKWTLEAQIRSATTQEEMDAVVW